MTKTDYQHTQGTTEFPTGVIFYVTPMAISSVSSSDMIVGWWVRPDTVNGLLAQGPFVQFKHIDVRFPNNQNGNEDALDGSNANMFSADDVQVDTAVAPQNLVPAVQGTLGMYGIRTTQGSEAGGTITNTSVWGYGTALDVPGEHTIVTNVELLLNDRCLDYGFRGGNVYHASEFDHVNCGDNIVGVTLGPNLQNASAANFSVLDFEDGNAKCFSAFEPSYHMKETNPGYTWGRVSYVRVLACTGNSILTNPFDGGGGTNFQLCGQGNSCGAPVYSTTDRKVYASNEYISCSGIGCTVTPLPPSPGVQLCVDQLPGSSSPITLSALGAGNYYSLTNNSAYGTANHALVSGGAVTDSICIVGVDSHHYKIKSYTGTWTD